MNRRFVLSYENATERTVRARYYVPKAKVTDYNVMIDGKRPAY